jgi:hypothetical protein
MAADAGTIRAMGQEISVERARPLEEALLGLGEAGCVVAMIDGCLVPPGSTVSEAWSEVRLRSAAGMLTLRRRGASVAVLVFGNAPPELQALQERVAAALRGA